MVRIVSFLVYGAMMEQEDSQENAGPERTGLSDRTGFQLGVCAIEELLIGIHGFICFMQGGKDLLPVFLKAASDGKTNIAEGRGDRS